MIFIGNLCEFIKRVIDKEDSGLFFPQNKEYVRTSDMVRTVARQHSREIVMPRVFNIAIKVVSVNLIKKVFGSLTYEKQNWSGNIILKKA